MNKDSPPYDVIAQGERLPMGLVVSRGDKIFADQGVDYTTDAPARVEVSPGAGTTITFTADTKEGLKLTKRFTFRDGTYLYDVDAEVGGAASDVKAIGFNMSQPLTERASEKSYRDYPTLEADVDGKVLNEYQKQLEKGLAPVEGDIAFAGIGDRYFLSAFIPKAPKKGELRMEYSGGDARAEMLFPGALKVSTAVYMGPKQLNLLEAASPDLSKAINFGWFGVLAIVFLRALQILHTIAPNYGWDIILLTLAVRLATLPASIKAQRSALRMQRLAPQVEKIRAKYKDDSTAAQPRDDGALQAQPRQSARRMHPDRDPVPHPLWPLRGAAQLNRATPCSVYRLDQGIYRRPTACRSRGCPRCRVSTVTASRSWSC